MKKDVLILNTLLFVLLSCTKTNENFSKTDTFDSSRVINLTEIIEDSLQNFSNETTEKKADSTLTSFLPDKIFDYMADVPKNTDLKISDDNFYQSVVRIYRKEDKMIGVNIMRLRNFKEKELTVNSSFEALKKLHQENKSTSDLENFKIKKGVDGVYLYSLSMKKSIILIGAYDQFFISISGEASLSKNQFRDIVNQINFERLKKLK